MQISLRRGVTTSSLHDAVKVLDRDRVQPNSIQLTHPYA